MEENNFKQNKKSACKTTSLLVKLECYKILTVFPLPCPPVTCFVSVLMNWEGPSETRNSFVQAFFFSVIVLTGKMTFKGLPRERTKIVNKLSVYKLSKIRQSVKTRHLLTQNTSLASGYGLSRDTVEHIIHKR